MLLIVGILKHVIKVDFASKLYFLMVFFIFHVQTLNFFLFLYLIRRQRTTFEGALRFRALLNTVTLIDGSILFKLVNKYDTEFNAELFGLQSNTIRLRVSEKEELVPRYEPPIGDVLVEAPIIEE